MTTPPAGARTKRAPSYDRRSARTSVPRKN